MRAVEEHGRLVEVALTPAQQPAQRDRQAQLADQALALGQLGAGLRRALDLRPVGAVHSELGERRVQLDLRRQRAHLLGQRQRLLVGRPR
jgi:hypothetical protein